MKKIKIMYVVSVLNHSGPTNQLLNIISNIDKDSFEFKIITLSPESSKTMIDQFEEFPIESLNLSRIKGIFFAKKLLLKKIKEYSPDVIHTSGIRADSILFALQKFKFLHTIRNFPEEDYKMKYGNLMGLLMAKKHIKVIKNSKLSFACSNSLRNKFKLKKNIDLNFIQNGVDTKKFYPISNSEKEILRKKHNIGKDEKIFITVGSLILRKNISLLIDFWNTIESNYKLYIVGDGPEKENLVSQSKKNPNIVFWGNVSNVQELLHLSDYYISASISEGLPNSVLEALSSSLPSILSNIDSHREIVELLPLNEQFLFDTKDELLNHIEKINRLNYNEISTHSVEMVLKNFSAEKMSKKYQEVYKVVANEK